MQEQMKAGEIEYNQGGMGLTVRGMKPAARFVP
jgi:hypothetical protein